MSRDLGALAKAALNGLKDFQLETVEHVHGRLFAPDATRRFLVADEVGLGKTLIARGVIARSIESLQDKVDRIDVVYICSNADIARQNIDRLRIGGTDSSALDTRLTLLPQHVSKLRHSRERINFVAFTPSTSFDLKDGMGRVDERALLYLMLRELWGLGNRAAPRNMLRGSASIDTLEKHAAGQDLSVIDHSLEITHMLGEAIATRDQAAVGAGQRSLRDEFLELCDAFPRYDSRATEEIGRRRARLVGELRALLAASCLSSLEPDLVILDEFQRFAHLLDPGNTDADLAQQLFSINDVRVLLLSATPYRMYTPHGDASGEDHYEDFVRTVNFLERAAPGADGIKPLLTEYRESMLELGLSGSSNRLEVAARTLEERLRRVMVRTERLGATEDRNGMLVEVKAPPLPITPKDALGYVAMSRIAKAVEHHDPVEYWKSAPYLLNFMESDYALTKRLERVRSDPTLRMEVARALSADGNHRLDLDQLDTHQEIDPGSGRLRRLLDLTVGQGAHRLLWLPPAMPYYRLGGPYAEPSLQQFTKRLVFTSWRFVPRAIASVLSYEAERRMLGKVKRSKLRGLLRFSMDDDRPTGMPVLAMTYPSSFLAKACDPLVLSREMSAEAGSDSAPDASAVLRAAREQVELALRRLPAGAAGGAVDQRWYWAAPLLLDMALDSEATREWLDDADQMLTWGGIDEEDETDDSWWSHVEEAQEMAFGSGKGLGRRPDDLSEVLAEFALGGPGTCLLRSMLRVVGLRTDALAGETGQRIRTSAARAAMAFRSLYNQPEVTANLQREAEGTAQEDAFWRVALRYGVNGCLQAVMDEYAHVLRDHLGLHEGAREEKVDKIAEHMRDALSLRAATVAARDIRPSEGGRTIEDGDSRRLRCHFAVRFGDQQADDGSVVTRADLVRRAFNSPFWPFVLATTSVGQEGLDFHPYCHSIIHWNLPTNPVDLEQREGRIHRYKGHAVRKNVATEFGKLMLSGEQADAWEELFRIAHARRPAGSSDIVPFWVFAPEGGARIERHVLALPSSREHEQVQRLLKALTLYRMVFGQPRQEDMLRFLMENVPAAQLQRALGATRITLAPEPHD